MGDASTARRRMFDLRRSWLDEQGRRVLDIELPALRTHAADVRRALRAKGPFELTYHCRSGSFDKVGFIDPERPTFQLVFGPDEPEGVWEITIEGFDPAGRWSRPLWRQYLFVQRRFRRSDAEIHALAQRHAPVFLFSGAEQYFPVSLQTLLCHPAIRACRDRMKIDTVFGKEVVPLPELGDFMRFNGHADYLLDFNVLSMRRSVFAQVGGDPANATIYYSYVEDPKRDRFFINYHLIYAFDTKAGISRLTGIGPHVFDRESMVLVFEGGEQPSAMIISGHLENQTISFMDALKSWSQGRIRVAFDDPGTLKLGDHPVIAVAQGSHALYPTSGVYQCSLLRELAGFLDPEVMPQETRALPPEQRTMQPEQVLLPGALSSRSLTSYRLRSLGLDRLTSHIEEDAADHDSHRAFLTFSGYWVDVPGTQNARFPPFTRKVGELPDWVDGAYDWSWDDLPERYRQNDARILAFLTENVADF